MRGDASPHPEENLVASVLRSDEVILMLARRALAAGNGSSRAQLAARYVLDDELRAVIAWPSGDDYARAAALYDRLGRLGDAALLRQAAAADGLAAEARARWNTRYDDRPVTPAQLLIASMRESGLIDFDPAGPLAGTDGAQYELGTYFAHGAVPEPVVVITGRGAQELVVDWPDFDAMHAWVASRGSTAAGALTPPPVPGGCRAWEEDLILARLVSRPRDVRLLVESLRPETFTTDVRYEVYRAVVNASMNGTSYCTPGEIAAELSTELAAVPRHALSRYGGETGPYLNSYLARLTATEVTRERAVSTAASLLQEDSRRRLARTSRSPARPAGPAAGGRVPAAALEPGPARQPPAPGSGPVQRL